MSKQLILCGNTETLKSEPDKNFFLNSVGKSREKHSHLIPLMIAEKQAPAYGHPGSDDQ